MTKLLRTSRSLCDTVRERLCPLIPHAAPIAIFDFPNHSNVGDSAIWIGELAFLQKYHKASKIIYVADAQFSLDQPLPKFKDDVIILIHGGGNVGDIWPRHQLLREKIINGYPANRIIQLPQSIHFDAHENFLIFQSVLQGHNDFHLLVRDEVSFSIGRELQQDRVVLCPDMAFCIDRMPSLDRSPAHQVVALLRTDKEVSEATGDDAVDAEALVEDWVTADRTFAERLERFLMSRYPAKTEPLRLGMFNFITKQRLNRGMALLSSGQVVVTDRLHGHILCTLAGLPHVVLDNKYGKIKSFRDTWKTGEGICLSASNVKEAIEAARKIAVARQSVNLSDA